jgi:hypothetical protein
MGTRAARKGQVPGPWAISIGSSYFLLTGATIVPEGRRRSTVLSTASGEFYKSAGEGQPTPAKAPADVLELSGQRTPFPRPYYAPGELRQKSCHRFSEMSRKLSRKKSALAHKKWYGTTHLKHIS